MKSLFIFLVSVLSLQAFATGTFTLIEINPLHGSSPLTATSDSAKTYYGAGPLSGFTELNGKLYFSAQSNPGDDELWVTDGTAAGTMEVKVINSPNGAGLGNLVNVGDHIVFMATDNDTTWDLWSTDGTGAGTTKIAVLNQPSNNALGPDNSSVLGNKLVFCTTDKLLVTDGTSPGTDSLLAIINYSQGYGYCDLNGKSYFLLPDTGGDVEIWRTDGTVVGTWEALDLDSVPNPIAHVYAMHAFNGKLYLSAAQSGQGADLYTFDGSDGGKLNRIVIDSSGNSNPHGFNLYDSSLYFIAGNGGSANIYRVSAADSVPQPLIPNSTFGSLGNLTIANGTAYCTSPDSQQILSVELSGFTYGTLNLGSSHLPHFHFADSSFLVGLNGQIFFEAYDNASGKEVFMQSDFTPAGTSVVMPAGNNTIHPFNCILSHGIQDVFDLKTWNNEVIVPANFTDAGRELWLFAPGAAGIEEQPAKERLFTMYPNPASDKLFVNVRGSESATELNISNVLGQVIFKQTLEPEITALELPGLSAGTYLVTLQQAGNRVEVQKLIVLR